MDYFNNKIVCDLIEARRPAGILSYLDEESIYPKATDQTLLQKLTRNLSKHAHYDTPSPRGGGGRDIFTIRHYAGDVTYCVVGMIDKNKDTLYRDLVSLVGSSTSPFLSSLYPESKQGINFKKPKTAGFQFREQMQKLVEHLYKCEPHYIRCIKSNDQKKGGLFNVERVKHQVAYLGLLENVKVSRAGFAYRQTFRLFYHRYKLISPTCWPHGSGDERRDTKQILDDMGVSPDAYQFGKTKVFVRKPVTLFSLEEMRERKLHDIAISIQTCFRVWQARKYFLELREKSMGIFNGKKRRRGSWVFYFMGDYIDAKNNINIAKIMAKYGDQRILFADMVDKTNRKHKTQPRVLVITERAMYFLTPNKFKMSRRIELGAITKLSMSAFADNYMVLHTNLDSDFVIACGRKAEITTLLKEERENLELNFANQIPYTCKKGGLFRSSGRVQHAIKFDEDDRMGSVQSSTMEETSKTSIMVRIPPSWALGPNFSWATSANPLLRLAEISLAGAASPRATMVA